MKSNDIGISSCKTRNIIKLDRVLKTENFFYYHKFFHKENKKVRFFYNARRQGWLMTLNLNKYKQMNSQIPDYIKLWFGDDWIWGQFLTNNEKYGVYKNRYAVHIKNTTIASSKTFFEKCVKKFSKVKFLSKFTEPLLDSYDVVHKSTRGKVSIIAILLSTSQWLVVSTAVYFILLAYDITNISILEVIPLYLSSIVLGAVSLLPGGLGVSEGSLAGFLNLFVDDISITLSISIIIRIFALWIGIIVGFVFLRFVRDVLFEK